MSDSLNPIDRSDGPIHDFFGLTYSSYQVVPRVLAQSMPHEWQARFVTLMEEMQQAFGYLGDVDYDVTPATEKEVSDLTGDEMRLVGVSTGLDAEGDLAFFDRDGTELRWEERLMVPVPDPLPPYSRGRTRVPRADQQPKAASS